MADHPTVTLHAGYEVNGHFVDGYIARPEGAEPRPGVVLISGMFGLNWNQRQITRRFGEAGFVALSLDLFDGDDVPGDIPTALQRKNSLDLGRAAEWIAGGAGFLHSLPWVGPEQQVGVVGFCLGGGLVLLSLARSDAFRAGVVYYQSVFPDASEIARITAPILAHYGTADHGTSQEEIDAFTAQLDANELRYEVEYYPGMGHGFVNTSSDRSAEAEEAASRSLERTYEFLRRELAV